MDRGECQGIRVRAGGLDGVIDPESGPLLTTEFFDSLNRQMAVGGGHVVKDSRHRWAAIVPIHDGPSLFVKRFRTIRWLDRLKYMFLPSRSTREWVVSRFLIEHGITTPKPLGAFERRRRWILEVCYFVTEALDQTEDLRTFCKSRFTREERSSAKAQTLELLAITIRRIHDVGLLHRDLHTGNFLVSQGGPGALYLIDLHRAQKQRTVSHRRRLWNVAQIFNSLDFMLGREDKRGFLTAYGPAALHPGKNLDASLKAIEKMIGKMVRRRRKSRAKRCLKESTLFSLGSRKGFKIYRRREIEEDDVLRIIKIHRSIALAHRDRLLKHGSRGVVSVVGETEKGGAPVCVKEYRYKTILDQLRNSLLRSKGKASWVAGNVLFSRGISPIKPLSFVEKRRFGLIHRGFLLTEFLNGYIELDRFLIQRFEKEARRGLGDFIQGFAQWVATLHGSGIYHRDLKACNILVGEKPTGWDFGLIDLEDVLLKSRIGIKEIQKSLVQINCSVPKTLTGGDRMRFFKAYLRANPVDVEEKVFIKEVTQKSLRRGIVYVSPRGVVEDHFK